MLIIDRFEGDDDEYAIVEKSESDKVIEMIEIRRELLPKDAAEGHVLREVDGKYEVDYEETQNRIKMLGEISKGLWKKPDPSMFSFNPSIYKKKSDS
ncbi:MAG: DUF3006 domain-containing protein [Paenibacillus macerans]|uniref:DUF3006 domain-containing protein n=1 Tax=Paenibacillus TaxID=44249 RepID=UPI002430B1A6|nr:DUF3006 domain-containing protein [Paenibacillus macerans]MBS5914240.1 DUF3006 domain-containing protein [Paenibacillus macerans]MDU7475586.1 DUF3006 domain-containing protein [Paenibacillus macerans]